MKITALLSAAIFIGSSLAKRNNGIWHGINCKGNGKCFTQHSLPRLLRLLELEFIAAPNDEDRFFAEEQLIGCINGRHGAICAFYQKGAAGTLSSAVSDLTELEVYGCKDCGSVPTVQGRSVRGGELTMNFISYEHVSRGVCGPEDGICIHNVDKHGQRWS